jgi:putative membrane protein
MVQYNPKVWFSIIFHSYSRQVIRTLRPALLFLTGFSALVCFFVLDFFSLSETQFKSTILIHQLLGIVLGLFLVFRVNSSYDRWWEGRKLWGSMVNNTRNLSLKFAAYLDAGDHLNRHWFAQMISNIPAALRDHLRGKHKLRELEWPEESEFLKAEHAVHVPNFVSGMLYKKVVQLVREGKLTTDQQWLLDRELKEFSDIIGACERIKNTPIPYSYAMYIKKFIFIYLITLPFGLVTTTNYLTIPVVLLISFILLSVELIAEEIEDPFGKEANDLPIDELTGKMRDNIREILY